jgi:dTDP-4-dehydrorhamnose reductase
MQTKILVTGANGQLGNELQVLATEHPAWEFVFTDLPLLDITNAAQVSDFVLRTCPQFIINCAAYTAVDKAESDEQTAYLINATAVQNLTSAAQQTGAYLVHISTDYVFDGKNHSPYRETELCNPQTVYGKTKQQGEAFAAAYPKSTIIRTAWLYSTFGNNFVKTMLRLGRERASIGVVADQIGTPTYAADLARAILQIVSATVQNPSAFKRGIYHFTNEGVCSWYDFAEAIMRQAGLSCKVSPIDTADYPTPAKRPAYSVLHKGKIKQRYGVAIRHWQAALEECLLKMK